MSESAQISSLELEVQSNANAAKKSLDSLVSTLNKIKTASKSASGLKSIADNLGLISSAASSDGTKNLNTMASTLEKLNSLSKLKISSTVAKQLNEITAAAKGMNGVSFSQITNLSASLSHLNNVKKGNLGTVLNQLKKVPEAVAGLNAIDQTTSEKVRQLVGSLSQISSIPKTNLSSIVNSLAKIPTVVNSLDDKKLDEFAAKINKITSSLQPLATQMTAIRGGFSSITSGINRVTNASNNMTNSFSGAGSASQTLGQKLGSLKAKLLVTAVAARSVAHVIANWINESTKYVEDLNLFTVAMGEYAQEAQGYAETVSQVMGIDPAQWMRNQGVFMTLATGFGVASDRSEIMSRNLTQLGYDISSFYNINVEEAFTKLQSGISGELEPLRRLGYDLSDARLKATALSLGIDKATQSMTQAEKAQLRYYAIMTQVTTAQGDMARTLDAPANQLRILQAQLTQAARALGNIFIPALNAVLPYAIAFLRAVREIANAIAELFGYTLPEVDYSGVNNIQSSADNATDSVEGTTDAVKELQKTIASFDELHILSDNTDDSNSGNGQNGNEFDFPLPEYDFLGDAVQSRADEIFDSMKPGIEWIKDHLDEILDVAKLIGVAFLAWKVGKGITSLFQTIAGIGKTFGLTTPGGNALTKLFTKGIGLTVGIAGFSIEANGAYHIGYGDADVMDYVKTAIGAALGVSGSLLVFGTGPVGWTVGLGIALTTFFTGVIVGGIEGDAHQNLADRFGDIVLTQDEIDAWAEELSTSGLTLKLDLYVDASQTYENAKEALEEATSDLRGYYIKSQVGIEVDKDEFISQVDSYVEDARETLRSRHEQMTLAVDIVLGTSTTGLQLQTALNSVFENAEDDLISLGEKLKKTINEGFSNGEWIADKKEEAQRLLDEMQEIQNDITSASLQATLKGLELDMGTDVSIESYEAVVQQAQDSVNEQISQLKDARQTALEAAALAYNRGEISEAEYNNMVNEIQGSYADGVAELQDKLADFQAQAFESAFSSEIEAVQKVDVSVIYDTTYENYTPEQLANMTAERYLGAIADRMRSNYTEYSSEVRGAAQMLLDNMSDTIANYTDAADAAWRVGDSIAPAIRDGLNSYYNAKYIEGDLSGMLYEAGVQAANSTTFFSALSTIKDMGSTMDESMRMGLLANAQPVFDEAGNLINGVTGTILVTASDVTDTLKENLADMGYTVGTSYSSNISDAAGNVDGNAVANEAISELQKAKNAVQQWINANNISASQLVVWDKSAYESEKAAAYAGGPSAGAQWEATHGRSYEEWKRLKGYASGGYPATGELFIAREAGAELVGRIGSKTAVANNDQITAAISSAVYTAIVNAKASGGDENAMYRAVARALNESSSDLVLQVDSEELYRASMSGKQKYGKRHNAMVEVL